MSGIYGSFKGTKIYVVDTKEQANEIKLDSNDAMIFVGEDAKSFLEDLLTNYELSK